MPDNKQGDAPIIDVIEGKRKIAVFMGAVRRGNNLYSYTNIGIPVWAFRLYNFDTMILAAGNTILHGIGLYL